MVSFTKSFYKNRLVRRIFFCFAFCLLITSFSLAQDYDPDKELLDKILISLATRADNFERSLPDFIATETLTQETIQTKYSKILDRNITVSRFTGRQMQITKKDTTQLDFQEFRQVESINGKTVKVDKFKARGPQVDGTFSSILLSHFASLDQNDYNFSLKKGVINFRDKQAYLINFVSRPKVSERQYYSFEGKRFISRQEGMALIDIDNLAPLRIEYREINLPKDIISMFYAVDYGVVELGNDTFLLPVEALSDIEDKKFINRVHQKYSDYKKFSTDVKIE